MQSDPRDETAPPPTAAPTEAASEFVVPEPAPPAPGEPEPFAEAPVAPPAPAVAARPAGPGLFWWLSILVIVIDQITKAMVRAAVPLYDTKPLIEGFIDLVHVRNEGVAFGLLNSLHLENKWVLTTALAGAALAGITYYARHIRREERFARIGLSLILGGAIGNLIDRLTMGYVLDFVDIYSGQWHFWAFNVADGSISVGAILVFVDLLLVKPHASDSV